jgi:flavin reductase (DIM6/NTAB) family NADH-FMN oxidoreductase RutF
MATPVTPPIDRQAFRQTIGTFATGITVIAADVEGEVHAMTANAVSSLSLEPLLVLVCVGKQARMSAMLQRAEGFSINILREEQQALSNFFAGIWKEESPPPFRFVSWDGGSRLQGCLATLGCEQHQILEGGDHWIVIGRVVALHMGIEPRKPLLFFGGRYGQLDISETADTPDLSRVVWPAQVFYDPWHHDE